MTMIDSGRHDYIVCVGIHEDGKQEEQLRIAQLGIHFDRLIVSSRVAGMKPAM